MEYKRNHTIPISILKYWIDENSSHKVVHVYDINCQRIFVSTSQSKKPFSFAIMNNLYITNSNGIRAVGLEKWFARQESSLSCLIKQAHNRQPIKVKSSFDMTKLMMALTGLEYRSNYDIKKICEFIKNNEMIRREISANPERPTEQLVLENIIHVVTEQHLDFMPTEMTFFFAPKNCYWIMCDRPYLKHKTLEYRLVVLTNKIIVSYRRSSAFNYNYIDMDNEYFEEINKLFIMNAREWIVSKNESDLVKYSALFQTDEWKKSLTEDKPVWQPIKNLTSGWTIDR